MTTFPYVLATRDDVTTSGDAGSYASTDARICAYRVLGPVPGQADSRFIASMGTSFDGFGTVGMITRTGSRITRGEVRVRFDFAVDTGDVAGTLEFGGEGEHCGGTAPAYLFGL